VASGNEQVAMGKTIVDQGVQGAFLMWLHPDLGLARQELQKIQQMLLSKFGSRWYLSNEDVEDCVQETLKRVVQNVEEDPDIRVMASLSQKYKYIHGVANNVMKERIDQGRRRSEREIALPDNGQIMDTDENPEERILTKIEQAQLLPCLDKCMAKKLSPVERRMIKFYYVRGSHYTKGLSLLFGASPNALRVRIHRIIRDKLRPCMEKCLAHLPID
jgi:RNA polymerase sigma factor (sigma-70 family)